MDFSQLPKMSNTPATPKPADSDVATEVTPVEAQHAQRRPPAYYAPVGYDPSFGSVWLSLIAGIIFLAMGQTFAKYLIGKMSGRELNTGWLQPDGVTPVKYFELQGGTAWSDMGLFLMGLALLLDALVLGILASRGNPNRTLLLLTVVVTSVALLLNASVVFYLFGIGIFPLASLIAMAVGGFIVFDHTPMLKRN